MVDEQRAEKLALAKKKLREFESRRGAGSPSHSVNASSHGDGRISALSANSSMNGRDREENGNNDIRSSQPDAPSNSDSFVHVNGAHLVSSTLSNGSSTASLPYFNGSSNGVETSSQGITQGWPVDDRVVQLGKERDAAIAGYEQMKNQLEQLHSHYSQLHSAYSQLSASGVHSDAEKQILQLQSALAVVVDEKTAVQAELRARDEKIEQLMLEQDQKKEADASPASSAEIRSLQSQLETCKAVLLARNEELDSQRKVTADAQAQLLSVQHERSEAQARLKGLFREKDSLEVELRSARKDLQMKDIHLKQLTSAHHSSHNEGHMDEHELKQLHDRVESLESELSGVRREKGEVERDAEAARRHYEQYRHELAEKSRALEAELEDAVEQRQLAERKSVELEDQLQLMLKDLELLRKAPDATEDTDKVSITKPAGLTEEELGHRVRDAVRKTEREWERRLETERKLREEEAGQKDRLLFEREQALAEASIRYRHLEERTNESRADQTQLLSLSDELQNEKATVSRAVAQNRELKEQLIETEDRLVALTNDKMQCELARQSAEHQVKELLKKLEGAGDMSVDPAIVVDHETAPPPAPTTDEAPDSKESTPAIEEDGESSEGVLRHPAGSMSSTVDRAERERELEHELRMAQQQLAEMRSDLRRSHTQNEEMNQIMMLNAEDENQNSFHVELGQAMNRIHALVVENEQLREEVLGLKSVVESTEVAQEEVPAVVSEDQPAVTQESTPSTDDVILPREESSSSVGSEEWARQELERKFSESMRRIAELQEEMDRVEHINMQLQLENDTIADHVVLYQHQRRLIRERLRAKDMQLSALENERTRVVDRCKELQQALMTVLGKNGILKEYSVSPVSPVISKKAAARRVSRTFSHSTVDEMSGDEDVLVVEEPHMLPTREEVSLQETSACEAASSSEEGHSPTPPTNTDEAVQKILNIINDISASPATAYNEKLHCTQCIGELKSL